MTEPDRTARQALPLWVVNLIGFGGLILLVLVAFFMQMHDIGRSMRKNVLARTEMVAAIIEENLSIASLALKTIDQTMATFLHDKAEFIAYLDGIDPLHTEELIALARETGLLGITLIRTRGRIDAPKDWIGQQVGCGSGPNQDLLDIQGNRIVIRHRVTDHQAGLACVITGIDGSDVARLRTKTSLDAILSTLSSLPGIISVDFRPGQTASGSTGVKLLEFQGRTIAQSTLQTAEGVLVVRLHAGPFVRRQRTIMAQFFLFSGLLLTLGLFFSWLLHRMQRKAMRQALAYEQALAREHEDAALGRTTATIAHEIRNPLNAISMGLQRLRLEDNQSAADRNSLIQAMEESVRRASVTLRNLQRFTRPLRPAPVSLELDRELQRILLLYEKQMQDQKIDLSCDGPDEPVRMVSDRDLINEILENLIKNSIEAQPQGGFIRIRFFPGPDQILLEIVNGGLSLSPGEAARIGEPYFTSKTRGTGLGLALSARIAAALSGELRIVPDCDAQTMTITLSLARALNQESAGTKESEDTGHGNPDRG